MKFGELLLKRFAKKSGSLEDKYKDMRGGSRYSKVLLNKENSYCLNCGPIITFIYKAL